MTKEEAHAFVNHIKTTDNPSVRPLVQRIDQYNRGLMNWERQGGSKITYKLLYRVGIVGTAMQTISTETDACRAVNCDGR